MTTTKVDDGATNLVPLAGAVDAASSPLERLAALRGLLEAAAAAERETVAQARAVGTSWPAVARALGVSKQAVSKRFGQRPDADEPVDGDALPARRQRPDPEWAVTLPGRRELLRGELLRVVKRRSGQ